MVCQQDTLIRNWSSIYLLRRDTLINSLLIIVEQTLECFSLK